MEEPSTSMERIWARFSGDKRFMTSIIVVMIAFVKQKHHLDSF